MLRELEGDIASPHLFDPASLDEDCTIDQVKNALVTIISSYMCLMHYAYKLGLKEAATRYHEQTLAGGELNAYFNSYLNSL